jgi:hypothetical protein
MRRTTAGCILLYADQPMQSLGSGKLNAFGFTLSMVNRFFRFLPAWSARQFNDQHASYLFNMLLFRLLLTRMARVKWGAVTPLRLRKSETSAVSTSVRCNDIKSNERGWPLRREPSVPLPPERPNSQNKAAPMDWTLT